MSISRNKKRKAAKAKRDDYAKSIARRIRSGEMPKYHFAKVGDRLERSPAKSRFHKPGITLRLLNTLTVLTKGADHTTVTQEAVETTGETDNGQG